MDVKGTFTARIRNYGNTISIGCRGGSTKASSFRNLKRGWDKWAGGKGKCNPDQCGALCGHVGAVLALFLVNGGVSIGIFFVLVFALSGEPLGSFPARTAVGSQVIWSCKGWLHIPYQKGQQGEHRGS